MKTIVGTCAICDEPIWMELSDASDGELDSLQLRREFAHLTEQHLRSHPKPILEQFWMRYFLDEIPPRERADAVKQIYSELRSLWADEDSRGMYSIDEVLGSPQVYRLWLDAHRCSYAACRHAEMPLSQ